jgi:toxin CcdB
VADILIRQFDVFRNPEQRASSLSYVVVLQSDLVSDTRTLMAAPLLEFREEFRRQQLFPLVRVLGHSLVIVVTQMAPVPRKLLRGPVANVAGERDRIVLALDYLFTGI